MRIVIGIYGESSAGKTAVAKVLARRLGGIVRHCGEIAKSRAKKLAIQVQDLPDHEHERLNNETRKLAEECAGVLVVEGRFLDRVLNGVPRCQLFRLECGEAERFRRSKKRKHITSRRALRQAKEIDGGEQFHSSKQKYQDHVNIKTDGKTILKVAKEVLKHLEHHFHDTT